MSAPIQDTLFGGAATPEPTITPTLPAAADTVLIDRRLLDCLHDVIFSAWGLAADEAIDAMATTAGQAAATRRGPHKHSEENWPQMKKQLADQHADHIRTIAAHASRSFHAYCHRVRELEKLGCEDLVPRFDDKEE